MFFVGLALACFEVEGESCEAGLPLLATAREALVDGVVLLGLARWLGAYACGTVSPLPADRQGTVPSACMSTHLTCQSERKHTIDQCLRRRREQLEAAYIDVELVDKL